FFDTGYSGTLAWGAPPAGRRLGRRAGRLACPARYDRRMAYDEDLAARIRDLIGPDPELTEKKMFGGLAFLIRGHMAISAAARAACWLGDSAIRPHALTSLIAQA